MTDESLELSRRKLLAGAGTIGVASVGAGLGTSAFFSDEEGFDDNQLVAGELDLHVGWEEHYSDWSDDEGDGISSIEMVGPGETADSSRVGLPLDADTAVNGSMITVDNVSQARRFLNNTETSPNGTYSNTTNFDPATVSGDPCEYLAAGSDQSPVIVDIDDVKPGDFGEVTFSFASCTNPGYVWVNGELQNADENGYTKPEFEDPDELGDDDGDGDDDTVELLDGVRAAMWYDDGDNLQAGGGGTTQEVDLVIVFDTSGSMDDQPGKLQSARDGAKALVDALGPGVNIGLVDFDDSASVVAPLGSSKSTVKNTISGFGADGGTDVGLGITTGQNELTGSNGRSNADKVMVLLTNGRSSSGVTEATSAKNAGTTIYGIAYGSGADENLIEDISSPPKNDDGTIDSADQFAFTGGQADIGQIFTNIGGIITSGEEVFAQGTLREVLSELEADPSNGDYGIPLDGDTSTAYDELNDGADAENRDCYEAETHHNLGFAWWLPPSVGNEIQSDSATFSLGFYTEQCRHNDGAGQPAGSS